MQIGRATSRALASLATAAAVTGTAAAAAAPGLSGRSSGLPADCARCAPSTTSCEFYSCVEDVYGCGPEGYPLAYGLKYCRAFNEAAPGFDAAGQEWQMATRLCLQQALSRAVLAVDAGGSQCPAKNEGQGEITCKQLNDEAFHSHPGCYLDSGVCKLPPRDWAAIVKAIGFEAVFGSWEAIEAATRTLVGCGEMYAWLVAQKALHGVV